MKVVVTGITGLHNRGVEAMLVPTIEQLCRRYENLRINILTPTIEYDKARLQRYDVGFLEMRLLHKSHLNRIQRLKEKFYPFHKAPLSRRHRPFMQAISDASAVIACGGDIFSSSYGNMERHLLPLQLAIEAGIPVVFLAHSIGPFTTDEEAEAWLSVARRSTVTVRETLSYDYVTKELGLLENCVKLTADPAFLLEPTPQNMVKRMLHHYGIKRNGPLVAIAVSQGISKFSKSDSGKHFEAWQQVISLLLNEIDAEILLIPHVHGGDPHLDDQDLATNLVRALDFDPRVRLVGGAHSAAEYKGLIAACDLVVAERMHAAIAALSSGVCTMTVSYSIKADGIMTDLLGEELIQSGLLISVQRFLDADAARTAVRAAWNRRNDAARQLAEVLPRVRADAMSNYQIVSQILDRNVR